MTDQEERFRQLQAEMERQAHPPSEHADESDRTRPFTAELKVTLTGADFALRPDGGLVELFRFVSRGTQEHDDGQAKGMAQLAAMYELLQASVVADQWPAFERHAMRSKATVQDVEPCIRQLIEAYTARPYWPGMRLLTTAAAHMAEMDGAVLMGTGRGIASYSAREVCNLMMSRLLEGHGEDERDVILEDLYLDYSPEGVALDQVFQMIAEKKRQAEEEAARGPADDGSGAAGEAGLRDDAGAEPEPEQEEATGDTGPAESDDHPAEADNAADPAADPDRGDDPAAEEPAGGEAG